MIKVISKSHILIVSLECPLPNHINIYMFEPYYTSTAFFILIQIVLHDYAHLVSKNALHLYGFVLWIWSCWELMQKNTSNKVFLSAVRSEIVGATSEATNLVAIHMLLYQCMHKVEVIWSGNKRYESYIDARDRG